MCRLLCNKIYSSTREGYGIFYEDELLDILPEESRIREALEAALKQLVNEGYIDVKYAKGNAFCILGLNSYKESEEITAAPAAPGTGMARRKILALIFAAAFAGGVLGSAIMGLIFYVIQI